MNIQLLNLKITGYKFKSKYSNHIYKLKCEKSNYTYIIKIYI